MRELKQTILEVINHLVNQHPELAPLVENIAQNIQGKGYLTSLEKELDLLFSFIGSKANIAIDIGGNIGSYTEQLLKRNPNMTVHIFEPSKTNIQILNDKFINNEKITINPLAVSETTGAATLFSNEPGSGLGSLSKRKLDHFGINFETTESISTIRFEEYWVEKLNSCEIDLVKIDVEGHELSVLNSFGAALFKTKYIQFEFGGTCIDTRTFFQDFWYFFSKKNYSIYRITPLGPQKIQKYSENHESFLYTNFIAVNNLYISSGQLIS
jgi:FkbM family methyltransferase